MSGQTGIEWTDATWNPVTGCTRVSPGCAHCYIERTPPFRMEGRRFTHGADGATTGVRLHPERLEQPLRWRKPRRVFVDSMSDLFHEDVPREFALAVWAVMEAAPQHTYQILTKRPERALELLGRERWGFTVLPSVWLGVSIENARFTWRADVLRETPAAVRFISAEPLIGSLIEGGRDVSQGRAPLDLTGIDWVIVGGESGPGARPMHPDWAREIRDTCLDISDPRPAFFFKQWGEWAPETRDSAYAYVQYHAAREIRDLGGQDGMVSRIGKKHAGRLLDGRTWDEFPAGTAVRA